MFIATHRGLAVNTFGRIASRRVELCSYDYFMAYFRAPISSIVSRVSQRSLTHCTPLVCSELYHAPMHSVRQTGLAVAETVMVERAQLIAQVNMAHHENCDTRCRWACATIFATKCAKTSYICAAKKV